MPDKKIIKKYAYDLIGYVGSFLVRDRLSASAEENGFMLRLDNLDNSALESIINAVYISNPIDGNADINILIPENLAINLNIPVECITKENSAGIRNLNVDDNRPILTATNETQLSDTMGNISSISRDDLKKANINIWLEACRSICKLNLVEADEQILSAALRALLKANSELSLSDFANFCSSICYYSNSNNEGLNIRRAVGASLPRIRLPKDIDYFDNQRFTKSITNWVKYFTKLKARERIFTRQDTYGRIFEREFLRANLNECLQNGIHFEEEVLDVINAYIDAADNDYSKSTDLFECDWEKDNIKKIFDVVKEKQTGLGDETQIHFTTEFEHNEVNQLTPEEVDFLKKLNGKIDKDDIPEIREFFARHKHDLYLRPTLYKRWEKIVFDHKVECSDFYQGLIKLFTNNIASCAQSEDGFYIEITVSGAKRNWLDKNYDVARFFSLMYKPLFVQLNNSGLVKIKHAFKNVDSCASPLTDYVDFFDGENNLKRESGDSKLARSKSKSKENRVIKFDVRVKNTDGSNADTSQFQLFWTTDLDVIGLELYDDLKRIADNGENPLLTTTVYRQPIDKKGGIHSVSLEDITTLDLKSSEGRGRLLSKSSDEVNLSIQLKDYIENLNSLTPIKEQLLDALDCFERSYKECIEEFLANGLNYDLAVRQASLFAKLLDLCTPGNFNAISEMESVLSLLLKVGTVDIANENIKIVAPWHPERLKSLAIRQQRVINYCINLVANSTEFIEKNLFNKACADEFSATISPEILYSEKDNANLLLSTSSVNGYSLYEEPVDLSLSKKFYTDSNVEKAAQEIEEFIISYLMLYPHLKSNLNIVLYENNIADLSYLLVSRLAEADDLADVKLNLTIMNSQYEKLDLTYRDLLNRIDKTQFELANREKNDVFLSNLRIALLRPESLKKDIDNIKPYDICILYDSFSTHAEVCWKKCSVNKSISKAITYNPSEVSYRYINPKEDKLSSVYLVSPVQTDTSKIYVQAISQFSKFKTDPEYTFLPVKTINLEKEYLKNLIRVSHDMADWVVSFDSLLEKRQLENASIEVVRYKKDRINGRNIIISSTSALTTINKILSDLLKGLVSVRFDADAVLDKIKRDALTLSGNVLLRAAKSYIFTYEMLGLILSKKILDEKFKKEQKFNSQQLVTYFMLDDYVSWFPTEDNRIADILAIGISKHNGRHHISIKIVESKFVGSARSEHKKKSYNQLRSTLNTFIKAYYNNDSLPVDKRQWHTRLAELILDTKIQDIGELDILNEAKQAILDGNFNLSLSGASLIFDYSQESVDELGTSIYAQEVTLGSDYNAHIYAHQLEFGRESVLSLFNAYVNDEGIEKILDNANNDSCIDHLFNEKEIRNVRLNFDEFDLFTHDISVHDIAIDSKQSVNTVTKLETENLVSGQTRTLNGDVAVTSEHKEDCSLDSVHKTVTDNNIEDSVQKQESKEIAVEGVLKSETEHKDVTVHHAVSYDKNWPNHIASLIAKYANNDKAIEAKQEKEKEANELADKLCRALRSYNFIAKKLHVRITPNGVAVTLQGNDSLTIDKILNRQTTLLTSHALSISTVVPKPGKIIVNIQNKNREIVKLWDIWAKRKINKDKNGVNTSFILAEQENEDALLYLNLSDKTFENLPSHDPHTLIAGTSGSGKSVLLRTLILDIAATNSSKDVKLILIDPKGGAEFNPFNCLPHMLMNTITTKEESVKALQNLIVEMDNRYIKFAEKSVTKLVDYNALCTDESEKLPYIFVVHDEFAEWMMDKEEYKDIVRDTVSRLGVKARAAGIFLIFAAQRPDSTVFPLQLRENLGNRLVLKVTNAATSDIATGVAKAHCESLMGNGHMIARLQNENILCQTPYIDDSEFREALEAIRLDNI